MSQPKQKLSDLQQLISDVHSHNINYTTREIYLHGAGGNNDEEPGVEYRMATTFVKNLHILEQIERSPILVHLHSIGGEWCDGMAIYDAIRLSPCPITMVTHAQASSMSGVILQAADRRVLTPNCSFMIHHGSISVSDHSVSAESVVDDNRRLRKVMLNLFAKRAIVGTFFKDRDYSVEKVERWLDKQIKEKIDWYLTAEEAIFYGFADGILGEPRFKRDKVCVKRKCRMI